MTIKISFWFRIQWGSHGKSVFCFFCLSFSIFLCPIKTSDLDHLKLLTGFICLNEFYYYDTLFSRLVENSFSRAHTHMKKSAFYLLKNMWCVLEVYFVSSRRHLVTDCHSGMLYMLVCILVCVLVSRRSLMLKCAPTTDFGCLFLSLSTLLFWDRASHWSTQFQLAWLSLDSPDIVLSLPASCWDFRHMLPHLPFSVILRN